ncbi:MAG: UDP-N-acetylmuramate--L-alanine ligase [Firmicutes bacterium]|nr:UDP-N-acetylmuramate--L-alanine ligase [Bacillota bacterium]
MQKNFLEQTIGKDASVYFIGIGGVSMSSLALITKRSGLRTGGSDRRLSEVTDTLANAGIKVNEGHRAENVEGYDVVVYTAAVGEDNPELKHAREQGLCVMKRAEYLGMLMKGSRNRIGVAGTHGKSTVTSMLAEIYMRAGLDPTVVSGAELCDMGGCYRVGDGDDFIFEACEYKDSFLSFFPTTAIITNIEYDHSDYFKSFEGMIESFRKYSELAGRAVLNADDPVSASLAEGYSGELVTWSVRGNKADYSAENCGFDHGKPSFDIVYRGDRLGRISLEVLGSHNEADAMAASAAALSAGISFEAVKEALKEFHGARRRFEFKGELNGAKIYDDYAHHPSEIKAVLEAAKAASDGGRVVCVFQPHTYTRTEQFLDGFVDALSMADVAVLTDIYAAREVNTSGISSKDIADRIKGAVYVGSLNSAADYVRKEAREGDTVILMGAGDIISLGDMLHK